MKVLEAEYATLEKTKELFNLFNSEIKTLFHKFSVIIIQLNGINYIVKDKWKDIYKTDEWNLEYILDKDFRIIDNKLLTRSIYLLKTSSLFNIGENIIIVCN